MLLSTINLHILYFINLMKVKNIFVLFVFLSIKVKKDVDFASTANVCH